MANLRGPGGMKQKNLIATFKDSQIVYKKDAEGKATDEKIGAFLTVQVDQSTMTQKAAKEGKADSNPYLESHEVQGADNTYVSHTVFYSQSQIDAMQQVGKTVSKDGLTAMAFKADVQKVTDKQSGEKRLIALTPKDVSKATNEEERAKIEDYNAKHPFGPSDNTKFSMKSLDAQAKITQLAKDNKPQRQAPEAEAQAQAEAEAAATGPEMG